MDYRDDTLSFDRYEVQEPDPMPVQGTPVDRFAGFTDDEISIMRVGLSMYAAKRWEECTDEEPGVMQDIYREMAEDAQALYREAFNARNI